mgnify:CR=1 FL=1
MIKMIGRFMIVLLVACLVAGGIYWLVQSNPFILGSQNGAPGAGDGRMRPGDDDGLAREQGSFGNGPRHDFGDGDFGRHNKMGSLDERSLGGIGRNLLIIAITTLAVVGIQKAVSLIQRRRIVKTVQP